MATLQQIGLKGFAGLAPTPVMAHAINNYLVNDKLMNLVEYVNIAMGDNLGNFQASYVYYEDTQEAAFRSLGEEYTANNATPKTGIVTLRNLGGSFKTDKAIERALGKNENAVSNWTEQQIQQIINGIKNGFSKFFVTGDNSSNNKAFDGLAAHFKKHTTQVVSDAHEVGEWSEATALAMEEFLNKAINMVKPGRPNAVITTVDGKSKLQTLNSYRHRGVEAIEVNGQKYEQYMGIPIVDLPDTYFESDDVSEKTPIIFVYFNEFDGVRVAVPMDGVMIDITQPVDGNGTLVKEGAVEFMGAPIFANKFCASKCFIAEKKASLPASDMRELAKQIKDVSEL